MCVFEGKMNAPIVCGHPRSYPKSPLSQRCIRKMILNWLEITWRETGRLLKPPTVTPSKISGTKPLVDKAKRKTKLTWHFIILEDWKTVTVNNCRKLIHMARTKSAAKSHRNEWSSNRILKTLFVHCLLLIS